MPASSRTADPIDVPSGTVTLLMTDIERSTRRWQENEGAMRAALERHDGIPWEAVRAHRGHVVKHTGDGMVAVFARAPDAIVAAVQAQRALQAAEWELASAMKRIASSSEDLPTSLTGIRGLVVRIEHGEGKVRVSKSTEPTPAEAPRAICPLSHLLDALRARRTWDRSWCRTRRPRWQPTGWSTASSWSM